MRTRNALLLMAAPAIALFLHCASKPKSTAESAPPASVSMLEAGADADTGAGGAAAEEAPPHPDPLLVQKLVDGTARSAPDEAATLGIRFEVAEMGPGSAWGMAVVNRGTEPVEVVFDPRLLVLEVEAPPDPNAKKWKPKPKPRICKLPDELRPARADAHFAARLEPGHGLVEAFDPRLYCLPEKGVSPLVLGAKVTARFGWAPKTKTVWKKGKREEEPLPLTEPFVAKVAPPLEQTPDAGADTATPHDGGAGDDHESSIQVIDGGEAPVAESGVKELHGTPFELGPEYSPPKPEAKSPEPFALELRNGSDARDETYATVALTLTNRSNRARQIYYRREFVSFEVSGPDGVTICDAGPDGRAPDRVAFTSLGSGGSLTSTSRLVELCPDDTFARPGLYVVNAQLDTFADGAEFGFDAFVGRLVSDRSVVVRIRTGSLPFPGPRILE
ncbi:MAG TPA: hypothetical protein VMS65_14055, partial [Polyangiaceae bacterium]|nr:hypothetical protein [Polyangiaceae bacterium]